MLRKEIREGNETVDPGSPTDTGRTYVIAEALLSAAASFSVRGHNVATSFVALCVVMLGAEVLSYRANSFVMQGAMADLRKSIVEKMLTGPIDVLERMQNHRVIVTLNHDVQELTGFFRGIPFVFVSFLTALACVVYLFNVSPRLAMLAAITATIPMYAFRRLLASAFRLFYAEHEARDKRNMTS